jgi:V/A-type H+-transporting ATPase subunit D
MSVASGSGVLPTKIELMAIRKRILTAKRVKKVLDDKREVLLKRIDEMVGRAEEARKGIHDPLDDAYTALNDAYLKLGPLRLEGIAASTPAVANLKVSLSKVLDIDIMSLSLDESEMGMTYGFADTSVAVDRACREMRRVLPRILEAAGYENAILRLVRDLRRTQLVLNALEYVIIPRYESSIRYIQQTLEEREREEFTRLKHVKKVLERKAAA